MIESLFDLATTPSLVLIAIATVIILAAGRWFRHKRQYSASSQTDDLGDTVEAQAIYHSDDGRWSMAVKTNEPIKKKEWDDVLGELNTNVHAIRTKDEQE